MSDETLIAYWNKAYIDLDLESIIIFGTVLHQRGYTRQHLETLNKLLNSDE